MPALAGSLSKSLSQIARNAGLNGANLMAVRRDSANDVSASGCPPRRAHVSSSQAMLKAGHDLVRFLQNHCDAMTTHDRFYSKGALNFDLTGLRLGEIAPPKDCAMLQQVLGNRQFTTDHVKLIVFRSAQEEHAAAAALDTNVTTGLVKNARTKKTTEITAEEMAEIEVRRFPYPATRPVA
jgi:hypothetical protein